MQLVLPFQAYSLESFPDGIQASKWKASTPMSRKGQYFAAVTKLYYIKVYIGSMPNEVFFRIFADLKKEQNYNLF